MQPVDLFRLALRGLMRRSTRTALTSVGIVVAVASMVIFLSLGEGIRKVFRSELGAIGPDIQVSVDGITQGGPPPVNVPETLAAQISEKRALYGIKSVTPVILSVRSGGFDVKQNYFFYTYPSSQGTQDILPNAEIATGRMLNAQDEGQKVAVVGHKAAQNGGFKLGSDVRYNRKNFFKVVGILKETGGLADSFILVPLLTMQKAQDIRGKVSYIALKLNDPSQAKTVAASLKKDFDVEAQTQSDFLKILDRAVSISDAIRFGISLIALIVGGLAVTNTVMMGVYERTREFGTMRAIGANPGFIRKLVLLESLILSVIGGLGGVVVGYLGIVGINIYTQNLSSISVAALTPRLMLIALGVSLVLGILAGLFPSRTAGRIAITEALGRS